VPVKQGIVVRASSGMYMVQLDGSVVQCTLRGNLKKEFQFNTSGSVARRVTRAKRGHTHDTVSVGDRVIISDTHEDSGVIEKILPRTSRFSRAGFRGREQTLVANLDQLCIVFACAEPRLDPWKLDRFLVAAESEDITPVIVANKRDLATELEFAASYGPFEELGYRVVRTSAKTDEGVEPLKIVIKDRISAFVGPSGVGKSSLLNAIQPGLKLKTGEIGYVTFKGRHTTTSTQLLPLDIGGWVADTPGLRELDILELEQQDLVYCFPEFKPYIGTCRFDDCSHEHEPGCAIKGAVDAGIIQIRRYESFLALRTELPSARK
jgi:ribosome biogenesis GTPase